jgi:excisionase family DNA binding protein
MEAPPAPVKRKAASEIPFSLLNTNQAAAVLGIGRRTLQELVAGREIGAIKIGKSIRFAQSDLEAFIERNRVKAIGWKGGRSSV